MDKFTSEKDLENYRQEVVKHKNSQKAYIAVCSETSCKAYASDRVVKAFEDELKKNKIGMDIKRTGCHGFCEKGPIVVLYPSETCYCKVKPEDVPEIVSTTIQHGKTVERLLYVDPATGKKIVNENDIPFNKYQKQLIFANNRKIDSRSLDDYIALGGYKALAKALFKMTPDKVLDEVKKSGLRGRGGGGFPAGRKWETTKNAKDPTKYVIVNCDEGDPGAYMNRSMMEGNPHSVIEGLIIGA